ncbi:MAG: RICIN domain-containing protein [Clostridiales bacterium]|nr:RICIN domain-containing protein [Clostridiales bacterium]
MRGRRIITSLLAILLAIAAIPIVCTTRVAAAESWLWPVENGLVVSSNYGLRDLYGTGRLENLHYGIDIVSYTHTTSGLAVRATKSGTIYEGYNQYADNTYVSGSCGNYAKIDHGDGTYSVYMHMRPNNLISGDVKQGDIIGYIGNTGDSYGAHLHFQLYTQSNNANGSTLNPMPTNSNITIVNTYLLPSGWSTEKTSYIFDVPETPSVPQGEPMTSGYDKVIPNGDYLIVNAGGSNKDQYYYLDIKGSAIPAENGTNVTLYTGRLMDEWDIWTVEYEDGFYRIHQKGTDVDLDVKGRVLDYGANVQAWKNNDQRWAISKNGKNGYRIESNISGLSLSVAGGDDQKNFVNGQNIELQPAADLDSQSWLFIPYDVPFYVPDGKYILLSGMDSSWELDVAGDTGVIPDGQNVQIWKDTAPSQYNSFYIEGVRGGYYKLIHAASGKALTIENSSMDYSANIALYPYEEEKPSQLWAFIRSGSKFYLYSRETGMVLDLQRASLENGANVIMYPYHGDANQLWEVVKAEYTVSYDLTGGSGDFPSQTKYYNASMCLSMKTPTRKGYTFAGWSTSKDSMTVEYKPDEVYNKNEDLQLYAVWKKNPRRVTTAPVTSAPVTKAPVTKAPVTKAPVTKAPVNGGTVTKTPVTKTPVTKTPVTKAPVTKTPVTKAPVNGGTVTKKPVTKTPVTKTPVTKAPVTKTPVTKAPVTKTPVTKAPVTKAPVNGRTVTKTPVTKTPVTKAPVTKTPGTSSSESKTQGKTGTSKESAFGEFVERLYKCAMNRTSDKQGKEFWIDEVVNGRRTGADCARFFLLDAPEFMQRNLSTEDFVETLYKTFFGRASEAAGKKFWVNALKNKSKTRVQVVNDFIDSIEWCNICAKYGVKSGAPTKKATVASSGAKDFATRLYTCCLGRSPEADGLEYWSLALTNLDKTGCSGAEFFFNSKEFVGFGLKNDEYVRRLYKTFMGRTPKASEVAYWVGEIENGNQTRSSVLKFFGDCKEFTNICRSYGIERE